MMPIFVHKQFKFIFSLLLVYCFIYYALKFITGIAVPGGMYCHFVDKYLNIAHYTRNAIMYSVSTLANLFNYHTYKESNYILRISNGTGIKLVYGCLAYGVMSFWMAYIITSSTTVIAKVKWGLIGLSVLWIVNVSRIFLVLLSTVHHWAFPLGINQHTWFNIIAYILIFIMIYLFEKKLKYSNE